MKGFKMNYYLPTKEEKRWFSTKGYSLDLYKWHTKTMPYFYQGYIYKWLIDNNHLHDNQDTIAIDIGANIGSTSLLLSSWFKEVHAFEPHPTTYSTLCKNVEANKVLCPNIIIQNAAVSNFTGVTHISDNTYSVTNSIGEVGIPVEVKTLDSLNLSNIGLIKIDVEGEETNVLLGAAEILRRENPLIVIETHFSKNDEIYLEIETVLKQFGYSPIIRFKDCPSKINSDTVFKKVMR
jgi:FkbM family methyltransferase